ncbi:hypothetical protein NDU88_008476 [Pleurodeles waltl]|uniref:Uncharacterized protein n=1 Tax=Pleurodeles waltl TaxID=8319 RepID=A0AAV7NZF7_PLEWA|nr:hypothetical protein NDU88_008476 [Pleurodeles waltl]
MPWLPCQALECPAQPSTLRILIMSAALLGAAEHFMLPLQRNFTQCCAISPQLGNSRSFKAKATACLIFSPFYYFSTCVKSVLPLRMRLIFTVLSARLTPPSYVTTFPMMQHQTPSVSASWRLCHAFKRTQARDAATPGQSLGGEILELTKSALCRAAGEAAARVKGPGARSGPFLRPRARSGVSGALLVYFELQICSSEPSGISVLFFSLSRVCVARICLLCRFAQRSLPICSAELMCTQRPLRGPLIADRGDATARTHTCAGAAEHSLPWSQREGEAG